MRGRRRRDETHIFRLQTPTMVSPREQTTRGLKVGHPPCLSSTLLLVPVHSYKYRTKEERSEINRHRHRDKEVDWSIEDNPPRENVDTKKEKGQWRGKITGKLGSLRLPKGRVTTVGSQGVGVDDQRGLRRVRRHLSGKEWLERSQMIKSHDRQRRIL